MDPNIAFTTEILQLDKPLKGIVMDNKDPLLLRRIRVKIQGVLEGETNSLPWAAPASGQGTGRRSNMGTYEVPKVGSMVQITFPNNDIYTPIYTDYTDDTADAQVHKVYTPNYPDERGRVEDNGSWQRADDVEGWDEDFHHSGRYIKTDSQGNVHIYIPKNLCLHIGGQLNVKVGEICGFVVGGNFGITTGRGFGVDATSTIGLQASGAISCEARHIHLNDGVVYPTAKMVQSTVASCSARVTTKKTALTALQKTVSLKGLACLDALKIFTTSLVGNNLTSLYAKYKEQVVNTVQNIQTQVGNVVQNVQNQVSSVVSNATSQVTNTLDTLPNNVSNAVSNQLNSGIQSVKNQAEAKIGNVQTVTRDMQSLKAKIEQTRTDTLDRISNNATDTLDSLPQKMTGGNTSTQILAGL